MRERESFYLNNDQEANAKANVLRVAVHACHDVDDRLANRDDHPEHYQKNKIREDFFYFK